MIFNIIIYQKSNQNNIQKKQKIQKKPQKKKKKEKKVHFTSIHLNQKVKLQ